MRDLKSFPLEIWKVVKTKDCPILREFPKLFFKNKIIFFELFYEMTSKIIHFFEEKSLTSII